MLFPQESSTSSSTLGRYRFICETDNDSPADEELVESAGCWYEEKVEPVIVRRLCCSLNDLCRIGFLPKLYKNFK